MAIRFINTRTGRKTEARDGRDLAAMVKIESDRRSGVEYAQAASHLQKPNGTRDSHVALRGGPVSQSKRKDTA